MLLLEIANHPLPECKWLCVRIVHPENADALVNPEFDYALEFLPESSPLRRLEVERIDVLVLFRRILGILDVSIRSSAKPFRMFLHVGMVRRTLVSKLQRDRYSMRIHRPYQIAKVLQRS